MKDVPVSEFSMRQNMQAPLLMLAEQTGGMAAVNTNDWKASLDELSQRTSPTSTRSATAATRGAADRPHTIEVSVKRKGLRVRTRKGYVEKSIETRTAEAVVASLSYPRDGQPARREPSRSASRKPYDRENYLLPVRISVPIGKLGLVPVGRSVRGAVLRVLRRARRARQPVRPADPAPGGPRARQGLRRGAAQGLLLRRHAPRRAGRPEARGRVRDSVSNLTSYLQKNVFVSVLPKETKPAEPGKPGRSARPSRGRIIGGRAQLPSLASLRPGARAGAREDAACRRRCRRAARRDLYRAFLEDASRVYGSRAAWTSVLYADPGPEDPLLASLFPAPWLRRAQGDGDLGARLRRAFEEELGAGAPSVVAVGGDHPALPARRLAEVFEALAAGDAAVVPAEDGGYCAIGLSAGAPVAEVFREIPWSTSAVLSTTLAADGESGLCDAAGSSRPTTSIARRISNGFAAISPGATRAATDFPSATAGALAALARRLRVIPVLDSRQMRAADAAAIRSGMPSDVLMENAGAALAEAVSPALPGLAARRRRVRPRQQRRRRPRRRAAARAFRHRGVRLHARRSRGVSRQIRRRTWPGPGRSAFLPSASPVRAAGASSPGLSRTATASSMRSSARA